MKITFTGISKEEAIKRLAAAAADDRAYAARMLTKGASDSESWADFYKDAADTAERKAAKCDAMADAIRRAEGDSFSISEKDEGTLYFSLAHGVNTFYAADSMYTITPEDIKEVPFEIMLAIGEANAAKTE